MFIDVSEVLAAPIIRPMITLMMEAASTPETSVYFYQTTRRNMTEDSYLRYIFQTNQPIPWGDIY
jgi:hypothetical protein